ncbi:MAG: cupin domain-containing protein [Sphingopyxis sp.]
MPFIPAETQDFISHVWQKKPLFIPNPWPCWENPLEPDELAGLACEDGVESRLITQNAGGWAMDHGPFDADHFATLGAAPWTLLVQAVDQHIPPVAALMDPFRYIPNWRLDDVMVSYATDGGGVGPHYDQYDVFLIQGLGRRRWQVGQMCNGTTALLPHDHLRLIADFTPTAQWVLEPGDILYVPPGIAHNGVAVGDDCMTYSVGFRAPSRSELLAHFCDHQLAGLVDDDRYTDQPAGLAAGHHPGEITPAALDRLHQMMVAAVADKRAFARWFGGYISAPKYRDMADEMGGDASGSAGADAADGAGAANVARQLAASVALVRNPASRFSYILQDDGAVTLFADGAAFDLPAADVPVVQALCADMGEMVALPPRPGASAIAAIAALVAQNSVAFDD